jgi:hypothetical protein
MAGAGFVPMETTLAILAQAVEPEGSPEKMASMRGGLGRRQTSYLTVVDGGDGEGWCSKS